MAALKLPPSMYSIASIITRPCSAVKVQRSRCGSGMQGKRWQRVGASSDRRSARNQAAAVGINPRTVLHMAELQMHTHLDGRPIQWHNAGVGAVMQQGGLPPKLLAVDPWQQLKHLRTAA